MRRFFNLPLDWFALLVPIVISVTGIVTIFTITYQEHGYRLATDQTVFFLLGLGALAYFMFSDYRSLQSYSKLIYFAGIILLIPLLPPIAQNVPFIPKVFGAHRWLDFGFFQLQPSEIFKVIAAIVGSSILANQLSRITVKTIGYYIAIALPPLAMVLFQPDLGTTAVLFVIFLTIFFAARPSWRTIIIFLASLAVLGSLVVANLQPYQRDRIETFLNPTADPLGEGYNVLQSLIAVGSGGLTGRGFGQGSQTVLNFLPVPHADFIYAGYAEATGFIGSIILLLLYLVLIFRALAIARDSTDPFGQLLAIGIAAKFFFQSVVHIAMNVGLLPVTGIPLPFMSYGGTAMIVDMAAAGILQSIAIRHKRVVFG
ncbi:MAG: rod shape-determining protein RodA [Patescibacteria group bacterium]